MLNFSLEAWIYVSKSLYYSIIFAAFGIPGKGIFSNFWPPLKVSLVSNSQKRKDAFMKVDKDFFISILQQHTKNKIKQKMVTIRIQGAKNMLQ